MSPTIMKRKMQKKKRKTRILNQTDHLLQKNKILVSIETVVLRRGKSETGKFGFIKRVDKLRIRNSFKSDNQPGTFKCTRTRYKTCPFISNMGKISGSIDPLKSSSA